MKPEPSPGLVLAVLLPIQLGKEGAVVPLFELAGPPSNGHDDDHHPAEYDEADADRVDFDELHLFRLG